MAFEKRINKMNNKDRLLKLEEKKLDRISNQTKRENLKFNLSFTNKEILLIQRKMRLLKARFGLTRADVLRKVLLNLDGEELICFLNLLDLDKFKK